MRSSVSGHEGRKRRPASGVKRIRYKETQRTPQEYVIEACVYWDIEHSLGATTKAATVYFPVLENASKAQKLRSTLGVFERSKFFFNLPGALLESIQGGKYDAAMRDYKKGKYLLESRAGILLPSSLKDETIAGGGASTEIQQKRILDKVWKAVEKVMEGMKSTLLNRLKEPSRSLEEHEKTIEYELDVSIFIHEKTDFPSLNSILLEISTSDKPIWVYFDSQHKYILQRIRTVYDIARQKVVG